MPDKMFTAKEYKEACKKPFLQTKIKMRKGFMAAPLTYEVLMVKQLSDKDRKEVFQGLAKATNPDKARVLFKTGPWSFRDISLVKDYEVGMLLYKGLGVAVFVKRQVAKIEPEPTDPVPADVIESRDDLWARLDMFSKSPRQLTATLQKEIMEKDEQIEDQLVELNASRIQIEALQKQLKTLQVPKTKSKRRIA